MKKKDERKHEHLKASSHQCEYSVQMCSQRTMSNKSKTGLVSNSAKIFFAEWLFAYTVYILLDNEILVFSLVFSIPRNVLIFI